MKPQDVVFLLTFLLICYTRSPKIAAGLGLFCLMLSIPLFSLWVFFTAERLTWYAAAFFFLSFVLSIFCKKQTQTS
jgi:hypothetical protein